MTNELSTTVYSYRIHLKDGRHTDRTKDAGIPIVEKFNNNQPFTVLVDGNIVKSYEITYIEDLDNTRLIKQLEGEDFFKKFNPVDDETEQNKWWCLNIAKPALSLVLKHGNIENALVEDKTGVVKQYLEDSIVDLQKQKDNGERVVHNAETIKNYKLYLTNLAN